MTTGPTALSLFREGLALIVEAAGVVLLVWLGFEVVFGTLHQSFELKALAVGLIGAVAWLLAPGAARNTPLPMLAYAGVALISAAVHQWGRVFGESGAAWWRLFEPAFYLVIMCALVLGAAHLLRTPRRLALFAVLMTASVFVVAVQLLFDRVSTNFLDPRLTMGFQYQPSVAQWGGLHQSGLLLVLGLPFVMALVIDGGSIWRMLAGLVLGCGLVFAGYVNGSRGGIFSMAVVAAAMVVVTMFTLRGRMRVLILGLFAIVPLGVSYAVLLGRTSMPPIKSWSGGRAHIWESAWNMFRDHPWLGVGPGNFTRAIIDGGYAAAHLSMFPDQTTDLAHAHNMLLQVAAETGVFGVLSLIALWAWMLAACWRAWRRGPVPLVAIGLCFAMAGFLARTMSDHFLDNLGTTPRTRVLVWLLLGAGLAVQRLSPKTVRAAP
jgi:O-antigen ligase